MNIRGLIDATNNGGLISYYYNHGADQLKDCMGALRDLQSHDVLTAVLEVNGLFPDGVVSANIDARNAVIESWADDDRIDRKLTAIDKRLFQQLPDLERRLNAYLHERTGI